MRIALAAHLIGLLLALPVAAGEEREGYYYPDISSEESFTIRLAPDPAIESTPARVEFLTELAQRQRQRAYAPRVVIFSKGHEARKVIAIGMDDQGFATIYRARAALADLTSEARVTPLLRDRKMHTVATFIDILTMLGFESLTLSDGKTWTHQITFEPREGG